MHALSPEGPAITKRPLTKQSLATLLNNAHIADALNRTFRHTRLHNLYIFSAFSGLIPAPWSAGPSLVRSQLRSINTKETELSRISSLFARLRSVDVQSSSRDSCTCVCYLSTNLSTRFSCQSRIRNAAGLPLYTVHLIGDYASLGAYISGTTTEYINLPPI